MCQALFLALAIPLCIRPHPSCQPGAWLAQHPQCLGVSIWCSYMHAFLWNVLSFILGKLRFSNSSTGSKVIYNCVEVLQSLLKAWVCIFVFTCIIGMRMLSQNSVLISDFVSFLYSTIADSVELSIQGLVRARLLCVRNYARNTTKFRMWGLPLNEESYIFLLCKFSRNNSTVAKATTLEPLPGVKPQFQSLSAVWPWANYLPSLSLSRSLWKTVKS